MAEAHYQRLMQRSIATGLIAAGLSLAACSSLPPEGSIARIKADQRLDLAKECYREPDRFGFPYPREEYVHWRRDVGRWMPDMHSYCFAVARRLVR